MEECLETVVSLMVYSHYCYGQNCFMLLLQLPVSVNYRTDFYVPVNPNYLLNVNSGFQES